MTDVLTTGKSFTKQTVGGNSNTWGTILNSTIELIDKAMAGQVTKAIVGNAAVSSTEATYLGVKVTGALGADATLVWPTYYGPLVVTNSTTGGYALVCGLASGTTVTVLSGHTAPIWSDGANFSTIKPSVAGATHVPSTRVDTDAITTAFTGDLSQVVNPVSHTVSGVATLGQPATGYQYNPETAIDYEYVYNLSGWNQATADNTGRTMCNARYVKLDNYGQGDMCATSVTGIVNSARAGATSFLANPAIARDTSDFYAAVSGCFLQATEDGSHDEGYDISAVHTVWNAYRTNDTAALGVTWMGYRVQSLGSKAIDAGVSIYGPTLVGIDLSAMSSVLDAAMYIPHDHRIYLNSTPGANTFPNTATPGSEYISYLQSQSAIVFNVGSNAPVAIGQNSVVLNTVQMFWPYLAASTSYADDVAAGLGGVIIGQIYRNGSHLMVRVA